MELKQYTNALFKWWWLILASTLVAALASLFAVSRQPPIYQARSTLMLGQALNNPNPTGNEFWLSQQLAQTYTDLAKRDPVRLATMDALGLEWLPAYSVGVVPNTQLIELKLTDTNPERAMVVANELANQIILRSPTNAQEQEDQGRQAFIKSQLDDLEKQIQATSLEIEAKQTELAGFFGARQIADAQVQINGLQAKRTTLQANYASLLASSQQGAINTLTVFESATLPTAPIGPNTLSTVLTAAAIGFILGTAAAYFLEILDDTVKTPEDILAVTKLPTMAGIAMIDEKGNDQYQVITLTQPRSPVSEAYRTLRTAVLFANVDQTSRTMLITSANPAEGKSTVAANLGVVLAQAGHRVLIIDADLRRPVQHVIFGILTNNYGLTNLLVQMLVEDDSNRSRQETQVLLEGAIHETRQRALYVLTSGSLPPNPAELVGSGKMHTLLGMLSELFDYVIIDGPPVLAVTDPVVLSTRSDSVLLVSSAGQTRRTQLRQATEQLREVNANMIGIVLNRVSAKTSGYYYYNYYSTSYFQIETGGDDKDGKVRAKRRKNKEEAVSKGKSRSGFLARIFGQ